MWYSQFVPDMKILPHKDMLIVNAITYLETLREWRELRWLSYFNS